MITKQMRSDFARCMVVLQPADDEPYRRDLREVDAAGGYELDGRQVTPASWIQAWRIELEAGK